MKKNLLFLSVLLCFFLTGFSKNRTVTEAFLVAYQFINNSVDGMMKAPSNSALSLSYTAKDSTTGCKSLYYIFDKGNENGYIIVSADDRTKSVLGYTDNGHFDIAAMPANLKDWLNYYKNEINSLSDSVVQLVNFTVPTISKIKNLVSGTFATSVNPLLGNIKWDQAAPYNNKCPLIDSITGEKAVTGCVATGMAQVMRYYKWPVKGTGSVTYTTWTLKIPLTLDFSTTTFDWDNMTETYNSSSTAAQNAAVAALMYNCGVSVSMDYNQTSNSNSKAMAVALKNNFGYDTNLQYYARDYYTRAEWVNLLKTELSAARPVLYRGATNTAGHLFVCDGYDSNGLFHFNWGWSGSSNGYYQISALDPDNQGIGSSVGGYNAGQGLVTGVQKPTTSSVPVYLMYTNQVLVASADSVTRSASFSVTAKSIYNMGVNTLAGSVGMALYSSSGTFIQLLTSGSVSLVANYGWSTKTLTTTIPTSIANGNYRIYYVYKASTESSWQIVRGKIGTPNYLNVTVKTAYVCFKAPTDVYPALMLNSLSTIGNLYQSKTGRFNVSITNNGAEYNSMVAIYLHSKTDTTYQLINEETINIAAGETRNMTFTGVISLNPGQYSLAVMYDKGNNISVMTQYYSLESTQTVNILAEPTGTPNLVLSSIIAFPNSANVDKYGTTLSAQITNTIGFFDNKLIAFIFPDSGGSSLTYLGYQSEVFDQNEQKTVNFTGPIDLTPGQYKVAIYYKNASNVWTRIIPTAYSTLNFTLVDNRTAINELRASSFEVYPNPVRDNLQLKTDALIHRIVVTDLLGRQLVKINSIESDLMSISVSSLKPGTYLIEIETDNERKTVKFIKN